MKNRLTLIIGAVLLLTTLSMKAQNVWDIQKCFDYALENNIQIKQQVLGTQYGETQVQQAKSDK
jgi:outer membrane protein